MNLGGEPDRDDFGLPPVDIEIPDDARELDRDVQAYRREQRALRRRQRRMRLHAPLTRDGVVLPLLASCLVLALIAGTLLTVFTAGPGDGLPGATGPSRGVSGAGGPVNGARAGNGSAGTGRTSATGPASPKAKSPAPSRADTPAAVPSTHKLPATKALEVSGRHVALQSLLANHASVVIALVLAPAQCGCAVAVRKLYSQVHAAGLRLYLVGPVGHAAATARLGKGLPKGGAIIGQDASGALFRSYRPTGLTALLVQPDRTVGVATKLTPGLLLTAQLDKLSAAANRAQSPGSTSAPASPAPRSPTPGSPAPGTQSPTSAPVATTSPR